MEPTLESIFLDCSARRLEQLGSRIDDCLGRLDDSQVWDRGGENQNAVGNLVLHLAGNVRQWIVSGVSGARDIRDRDSEFAAHGGASVRDLRERLGGRIQEAVKVIGSVPAARLAERVVIQGYNVTVLEAIYHVVEHFAQHTGQIIFATKAATGEDLGYYAHLSKKAHGQPTP